MNEQIFSSRRDLLKASATVGVAACATPLILGSAAAQSAPATAIFHKDSRHSPKLVRLGTLDSGIDLMRQRGPLNVTIRRVGQ